MSQSAAVPPDSPARVEDVQPWYRPGIADLIFLLVALAVLRGSVQGLLDDPGLGWHLRNIDAMLEVGGWLRSDPFSDPRGKEPPQWYTNQWLGELPFWLGWRLAGLEGIAVALALVIALTIRCLYVMLLRDGLPWPLAVCWTALGAAGTSVSWNARPNVFTILLVLLTARVCERFSAGALSRGRTWWLAPLFALWANIHGGFVAGLIILVATTLCELARAVGSLGAEDRASARARCLHMIFLTAGCLLATLVNPYGAELYSWVFRLLGDDYFMKLHQEWKSPDFQGGGAIRFEILMLLFPLLLGLGARRPNLTELGLAVIWLHLALGGFRYVALWVVVVVPLLARSSMEVPYLRELARRAGLSAERGSLFAISTAAPGWSWTLFLALCLPVAGWLVQGRLSRHGEKIIATTALDRFLEIEKKWSEKHDGKRPVLFHSYNWGGYLTWHGWPAVRNWIDDRNEVQGKEHVKEHFQIVNAEPGWQEKLLRADLICVELDAAVTSRLLEDAASSAPHWRKRYDDEQAIIFERVRPG
jgi:hypothetical protein